VSFSDIVLPDRGKRPDDVVREGPEPHEHERRKRDEPRRFDPEKRDDEPGETGDDQPQLHVRETPGVEVAPDQTGTNCVIAPMIVIQIHPANRRWRWASRPSPGTAFRCKPIPTPIPATRKASPTTKCRNGTVIGAVGPSRCFPESRP